MSQTGWVDWTERLAARMRQHEAIWRWAMECAVELNRAMRVRPDPFRSRRNATRRPRG